MLAQPDEDSGQPLSREARESLRAFLEDLRDHFEHYHERKENMAWAATTIYIAGITALASLVYNNTNVNLDIHSRLTLVALVLGTWWFALKFIRTQFADREIAAYITASCGEVSSLLADPESIVTRSQIKPHHYTKDQRPYVWPKILCDRLEDESSRKAKHLNWNEFSPLGVMFIWTAIVTTTNICLPFECARDHTRLWWIAIILVAQLVILWNVGYWNLISRKQVST